MNKPDNEDSVPIGTKDTEAIVKTPGVSQSAGNAPIPDYRRRAFETRYGAELPNGDEREDQRQDDV